MGKNKLRKWADMEEYPNVLQPRFEDVFRKDHALKGKWKTDFFPNNKPLVLELGCGRGEYTLGLARHFSAKNFLGIDIKGARMWKGAGTAIKEAITNVGFLRTRIELIESFFGSGEVDEIWITFPDPQLKKRRNKKRLTGPRFLNHYRSFLKNGGLIHLKTDSRELYDYTLRLIRENKMEIIKNTDDLYAEKNITELLRIRTHYEEMFLDEGRKICYICFSPDLSRPVNELKSEDDR
ncbi:MAG: tRNA (guanosine(46)-N7)-methyltransferase TrmB [Bacteroidales bacterium]|nr:tRNA (guanosine(46)-N7)-methyltransferase TrmB [Bacteroidales bacterium]